MPQIDYMKVLDTAAFTLDSSSHVETSALDLKLFSAVLTQDDGAKIEIQMKVSDYELELSLDKELFDNKALQKWLSKFEYQLEQHFFKNFALNVVETQQFYRIKIPV